MDKKKAIQIVRECREFRQRWGRLGGQDGLGAYTVDDLIDALAELDEELNVQQTASQEASATSNRQAGASRAREAKLKKKIEKLEQELSSLQK